MAKHLVLSNFCLVSRAFVTNANDVKQNAIRGSFSRLDNVKIFLIRKEVSSDGKTVKVFYYNGDLKVMDL